MCLTFTGTTYPFAPQEIKRQTGICLCLQQVRTLAAACLSCRQIWIHGIVTALRSFASALVAFRRA